MRGIWWIVVAMLVGGCAAPPISLELNRPTEDFAFSLIVLPRPEGSAEFVSAAYVVEPDRMMRVAVGEDVVDQLYPAPARVLTHPEFNRVWNLALESGLLDLEREGVEVTTEAIRTWYVRGGKRFQASFGPDDMADLRPLLEELERLAWLRK